MPGSWHLLDRAQCRLFLIQMETWWCPHLVSILLLKVKNGREKFLGEKYSCDASSKDKFPQLCIFLQTVSPVTRWKSLIEYVQVFRPKKDVCQNAEMLEGSKFSDWVLAKEIVQEFHPCQPLNSPIEGVRRADVGGVHRNALNVNKINPPTPNPPDPRNSSHVEGEEKTTPILELQQKLDPRWSPTNGGRLGICPAKSKIWILWWVHFFALPFYAIDSVYL